MHSATSTTEPLSEASSLPHDCGPVWCFTHALFTTSSVCLAQDTVTGFLLAGVGNMDLRRKGNFLVVNESAQP